MPGSDCFETGYHLSAMIRFIAAISIDDPCDTPVMDWKGHLLDFCAQRQYESRNRDEAQKKVAKTVENDAFV